MLVELITIGCGMALLCSAAGWRVGVHRLQRRRLAAALTDPDPDRRRAALTVLGQGGIRPYADLVLSVARTESDTSVLTTLVQAVCRNQWEPADDPSLVELRRHVLGLIDAAVAADPPAAVDAPPPEELAAATFLAAISAAIGEEVTEIRLFADHEQLTPVVLRPPLARPARARRARSRA